MNPYDWPDDSPAPDSTALTTTPPTTPQATPTATPAVTPAAAPPAAWTPIAAAASRIPPPARPRRRRILGLGVVLGVSALVAMTILGGAIGGAATAIWLDARDGSSRAPAAVAGTGDVWLAEPAASTATGEGTLLQAVRATRPAVVTVWNMQYVRQSWNAPAQLAPASSGSGVIFDARGYVATNAHVVDGARSLEVVLINGQRAAATLVNLDTNYDVAILKVADGTVLPAVAPLADSAALEPGMAVIAIGSPLGTDYQNSVTSGIIAGLNRRVKDLAPRAAGPWGYTLEERDVNGAPLIQTDAAINSGNSGGPLIDLRGQIVGLNTLIVRREGQSDVEGFGFAIPSNVVNALADEWIDNQPRGCLGITFAPLDPEVARELSLARAAGAYVSGVPNAAGTGALAGLREGDVIIAVDKVDLNLDRGLRDVLWRYRAGDTVTLTLDRGGQILETSLVLDRCEAVVQPTN
ncbi:MAG: trypsin-like peptidase domain-containing protein [Ardenticatenales bacterium]|nr:trypsin-like peptidase domain-containing protein [Ardenticatenales bacterium]